MPLYRLVISLEPKYQSLSRAAAHCQMVHWALAGDDDAAMSCGARLAAHVNGAGTLFEGMSWLWCVLRGPAQVHRVTVERWASGNRDATVGARRFSLPDLPDVDGGISLGDVIGGELQAIHPMESASSAVTVQVFSDAGTFRRSYVGPISPLAFRLAVTLPLVGEVADVIIGSRFGWLGDIVVGDLISTGLPGVDYTADRWPDGFASAVAGWVGAIDGAYDDAGQAVVVAGDTISPVAAVRASDLPAHITSRSRRGEWAS